MVDFSENAAILADIRDAIGLIRGGASDPIVAARTGLMVCEVAAVRASPFKSALVPDPNNRPQFDEARDHRLTGEREGKPLTASILL